MLTQIWTSLMGIGIDGSWRVVSIHLQGPVLRQSRRGHKRHNRIVSKFSPPLHISGMQRHRKWLLRGAFFFFPPWGKLPQVARFSIRVFIKHLHQRAIPVPIPMSFCIENIIFEKYWFQAPAIVYHQPISANFGPPPAPDSESTRRIVAHLRQLALALGAINMVQIIWYSRVSHH